jgi:hypothetical protein
LLGAKGKAFEAHDFAALAFQAQLGIWDEYVLGVFQPLLASQRRQHTSESGFDKAVLQD